MQQKKKGSTSHAINVTFGKNFESLNRFEKQAIASAAGIQDMTEANKLFSMSLSI